MKHKLSNMDKEELRKRMSKAIGTFENQMVRRISEDCAEIAMQYFTEQLNIHGIMQGLPVEFVEWLGDHYIKMHGGWMPKYSNQIKPNLKTTLEIYEAYHALKDILNCPTIAHTSSPAVASEGLDKNA